MITCLSLAGVAPKGRDVLQRPNIGPPEAIIFFILNAEAVRKALEGHKRVGPHPGALPCHRATCVGPLPGHMRLTTAVRSATAAAARPAAAESLRRRLGGAAAAAAALGHYNAERKLGRGAHCRPWYKEAVQIQQI